MEKLYWVMINTDYLDYLKQHETRIPNYDYNREHIKPFYGVLFEKNDLCYVTTINHYKEEHSKLTTAIDCQKIYDNQYGKTIAVARLNYMFPVPKNQFERLDYRNIDNYVDFKDEVAKYNQITLLKKILFGLNHSGLQNRAQIVYKNKYERPDSYMAKRCFDFKQLEELAKEYHIDFDLDEEQDITDTANEIANEINENIEFIKIK